MLRRNLPMPRKRAGEAIIAVRVAGVCQTDLEIAKGYMGFRGVLGHEFVGLVHRGPREWLGRRVVGEINCPCGRCRLCRCGMGNHCPTRTVLGIAGRGGAFAEFLALPVANLHAVDDSLSDEEAVFIEPLAAAFQGALQAHLQKTDHVVILGDGRLGQLQAQVAALYSRDVTLVGKHAWKLALATAPIRTCLLREFDPRPRADVVFDATGSARGIDLAMRSVRPRGKIVLKTTTASAGDVNLAPLVIDEIEVIGSRCGPFKTALEALTRRRVDVLRYVSQSFPLVRAAEALAFAQRPASMKVLLDVASK